MFEGEGAIQGVFSCIHLKRLADHSLIGSDDKFPATFSLPPLSLSLSLLLSVFVILVTCFPVQEAIPDAQWLCVSRFVSRDTVDKKQLPA